MKMPILNAVLTVFLIIACLVAIDRAATLSKTLKLYQEKSQLLLDEYDSILVDWAGEDVADSVKQGVNYEEWINLLDE